MNSAAQPFEVHITVSEADSNAVQLLHDATGLPKQQVKAAMSNGAVWLTGDAGAQRLRCAKRLLKIGDEVHLYYDERVQTEIPPTPTLIEDVGEYSVWYKPSGMRSQGSKWGDHCTIGRWSEQHLQPERNAFTVHRLDLAASGLMLVAHSKTLAAALSELFRERRIDKRYKAIVNGDFSANATPLRIAEPIDGKASCSEAGFERLVGDGRHSLVEVRIETGRKHQIRRHLADAGFPVIGDRLYGGAALDEVDLQLVAYRLAFRCPVKEQDVVYVLPDNLWGLSKNRQ